MNRVLLLITAVVISAIASSWRTAGQISDYPVGGRALLYQSVQTPVESEGDAYSVTVYSAISQIFDTGSGKTLALPFLLTETQATSAISLPGNRPAGHEPAPLPRTALSILSRLNI